MLETLVCSEGEIRSHRQSGPTVRSLIESPDGASVQELVENGGTLGVRSKAAGPTFTSRGVPTVGPVSYVVAWIVMFVLGFGLPTDWFVVDRGSFDATSTPPQGIVPAILVLAAAFATVTTLHIGETYVRLIAIEPLLACFVALLVVSTLWSAFPSLTLRFSTPLLVVLFLGYWMVSVFRLDQLLGILVTVLAVGMFVQYLFVFGLPQFGQSRLGWSGTGINKNVLGRDMAFATANFVIAAGVFRRYRIILVVLAALSMVLVVGSESATSLTGTIFVVGMIVVSQLFRSRRTLYGAIGVSLLGGGAVAIFIATANLALLADLLGKDVTLTGRTLLWEASLREGFNRPLLGHGWGGFWQGWLSPSRPVLDLNTWQPPHAHNALIDYFVTVGLVGVLLAVGFFVRFFVRSARVVRNRPGALGLWPIAIASFAFVFSISEFGIVSRSLFFLMFVVHVSVAGLDRRQRRLPSHGSTVDMSTGIQPVQLLEVRS